jgi:outer membrane beta-barrel protein
MKLKSLYSTLLILAFVAMLGPIATVSASETADSLGKWSYEKSRQFEVGPFVGYHFFEGKQNLKDSLSYGGRLGYNFTKYFGVEGSLGMVKSHVKDKTKTGVQKGQYRFPTNGVDLTTYQLNAVYQFNPDERFTLFALGGIGSIRYSPEVLNNNSSTINYGLGGKYWVKRDVALRVDLTDQMNDSLHNYSATAELVFALGRRSRKAPDRVAKAGPKEIIVVSEASPRVEEKVRSFATEPTDEEKIIVLAFEDIHFNFDKSTLTELAQEILKRSIEILKDNPRTSVRIAGYTSASGTNEYNQRLSERRAKAVESYLVREGLISPDRLSTIGYGEHSPALYEAAPKELYSKAAKANMRVLFETIMN